MIAVSTFSTIGAWLFPCKLSANLCMWRLPDIVHWLAERQSSRRESYFKYGRSKGSISQERERESRCRLLVMSSWPDVGALVISWKKANEPRRTKFSLMVLHPESSKEWCFFWTSLFSLFELIEEIRRIADIHMHAIVALVLFKTQLLHDARHFVWNSRG